MFASSLLALALAAEPMAVNSVSFEGPLKQGLTTIAERGGLNLIVVGDLAEPARIHLTDVTAEEALEAVAQIYQLELTRQGKLFVIRPKPAAPAAAAQDPKSTVKEIIAEVERGQKELETLMEQAEALEQEQERAEAAAEANPAAAAPAPLAEKTESKGTASTGPVTIKSGTSTKEAVAFGGPLLIEKGAKVRGDAVAFGGDVTLQDGAVVEGDAVSFGGRVLREGSAVVKGEEVSFGSSGIASSMAAHAVKASNAVDPEANDEAAHGLSLAGFLVQFMVFFVFGFLLMVFAPQRMKGLESAVRNQPVISGVVGFLALLGAVPLTLFLVVTLIGIPVAGLLWAALALVVPMGLAAVANTLGTSVPMGRVRRTQAMVLALGLLVLLLVAQVPVLGPLVLSLAVCVSLGAVLRTRLGATPKGLPVMESPERLGV